MNKIKVYFIGFCTILMLFSSIKVGFFHAFYFIDREGFTQLFCENKERPEMKCNGKCQMEKMAKSDTEETKKTSEFKFQPNDIPLIYEEINYFIFSKEVETKPNNFNYINFYHFSLEEAIFRPPIA
ncbi:hypothetical protein KRX57_03885 [Weeksellaceae bacterium TAE3-ERU29]|nr:hypothetical protein [Weeksellaceae bacterium TAE3-ERU29]